MSDAQELKLPIFEGMRVLGAMEPFIVTDKKGVPWRFDPMKGTARKVTFETEG